jgi:hypothetical protein
MKIAGIDYTPSTSAITVITTGGAEALLTITRFPSGFNEAENHLFPEPKLGHRIARSGSGKIQRDANGKPVTVPDDASPAYQNAMLSMVKLRTVRRFWMALRDDPNVEWGTEVPDSVANGTADGSEATEVFSAMFVEAESTGFGLAQMQQVCEIAAQLTGMLATEARGAAEATFHGPAE